jgi:hypothetical protein
LEHVEKINATLSEHINQQLNNYQTQISLKDTEIYHVKKKYDRLLGSLKLATEA